MQPRTETQTTLVRPQRALQMFRLGCIGGCMRAQYLHDACMHARFCHTHERDCPRGVLWAPDAMVVALLHGSCVSALPSHAV